MTKVSGFMICAALEQCPDSQGNVELIAKNPGFALHPPCIPSAFTFSTLIGVRGLDVSVPNVARTRILDPEGTLIHDSGDTELPADDRKNADVAEEQEETMLGYTVQNLFLDREGTYTFQCYVNGEPLAPQKVPVYL